MAPSGSDAKILRIGVIQGGKVIEERLVRKRTTVTFGSDNKNTFVFSGGEFPKSWPLFELKGSQYHLVFSDKMDGRVSVDDNNIDFASLKAQELAQKQGDRYRLALTDSSRGRVQFGPDLTILFHFVAAPPVAAKPELPVSAKGGWVKSIEPVFTTVLTVSFLIHALMTIVVFNVEPPPPPSKEEVLRAIARVQPPKIETPEPDIPDKPDPNKTGNKAPKKEQKKDEGDGEQAKEKSKGKPDSAAAARAAEARRKAVREQIAGKGLLAMIGSTGAGDSDSAVGNVFGSGSAIGGDLQNALEGTSGVGVATGGGDITRRGSGGGGGGGAADIGGLSAGGGGKVGTGGKKVAKVTGRVRADAIEGLDGTIDKKGVARTIRRRQQAFQQCYESALKSNSKLSGKLVVEFVIDENGRVREATVIKDGLGSTEVSRCVIGTLKRLRFPKPEDGEVTITNAFVFQPGG